MTAPDTLFVNVQVLDGTGAPPFAGEVLVRGERIAHVGLASSVSRSVGARIVDGQGGTLMPGLCDAHSHITWLNQASRDALADMPLEEHTLAAMHNARTYLDCGYTMVVSGASAKPRIDVVIRDAINRGQIEGPRFLANGPIVTTNRDLSEMQATGKRHFVDVDIIDDAAGMEACVERLLQVRPDFVKLTLSGESITGVPATHTFMTDEEVAAAVRTAARRNVRVCAHARSAESVKICARQGVPLIFHASYSDEHLLDLLESVRDELFVAPGINWLYATCYEAEAWDISRSRAESLGYIDELSAAIDTMRALHKRGVRILPGGDYGFAWCPHGTYARDLQHFVELFGFTTMETLVAATQRGAELFNRAHELGAVRPGYLADLILVDGDPIEDITLLQDRNRIRVVMKDGNICRDRTSVDARRAA